MNKQIEKYIALAMPVLEKEKSLDKEFKGYIASLGPAIKMSGLIPAIAFYSELDDKKKKDKEIKRWKVMDWIFQILKNENAFSNLVENNNMLKLALSLKTKSDIKKLEQQIMHISIALKLCLRTFELTD